MTELNNGKVQTSVLTEYSIKLFNGWVFYISIIKGLHGRCKDFEFAFGFTKDTNDDY